MEHTEQSVPHSRNKATRTAFTLRCPLARITSISRVVHSRQVCAHEVLSAFLP